MKKKPLFVRAAVCVCIAVAGILLAAGCGGQGAEAVKPPDVSYLSADRSTHTAWGRYVRQYKADHPAEAGEIDDLYTSWGRRISEAEKNAAAATQPAK
jgi:hypothetical protein